MVRLWDFLYLPHVSVADVQISDQPVYLHLGRKPHLDFHGPVQHSALQERCCVLLGLLTARRSCDHALKSRIARLTLVGFNHHLRHAVFVMPHEILSFLCLCMTYFAAFLESLSLWQPATGNPVVDGVLRRGSKLALSELFLTGPEFLVWVRLRSWHALCAYLSGLDSLLWDVTSNVLDRSFWPV